MSAARNYKTIVRNIYLTLPFTLVKQKLGFRFRKAPAGLPQFMCIGAQKAGTTWLYEQLQRHPGISLADGKEVHYFDWYFHKPLSWYVTQFGSGNGLRGEITPGYSVIETGRIRFMQRIMPGLKIIFLLRDPRERAWSSARFHFGKELGRDLQKVPVEEFISHFNKRWVRERGDYETTWRKWTSVFPREQFLVLFTEEIAGSPDAVLKTVCDFLRVPVITAQKAIFPNKSEELAMPAEVKKYLDHMYEPMIRRMKTWLGQENKTWI